MNAILFKFTMPKQPRFQSKEPSINLVSKDIYYRIDGVLLASSKYGKRQLVIKNIISRLIGTNLKLRDILNEK